MSYRSHYRTYQLLFYSVMSIILATILIKMPHHNTTYNDSLSVKNSPEVLGVKDYDQNSCPYNQPIIGIIDEKGRQLIIQNLQENQTPSSCFEDEHTANTAGYYKE